MYPPLPPLPCIVKKVTALLKQWVKDSIVQLPIVNPAPTPVKERDPNFCPYHRRKGHSLEQCFVFRKTFDKKLKDGEIILQMRALVTCMSDPSPTITTTRARGHAMMVSTPASTVGTEGKLDIDQMAGRV